MSSQDPTSDALVVEHTHSGVVTSLPRWPSDGALALASALGWLAIVLASLTALGLPGASLVEGLGLWMVNERVFELRWLAVGFAAWPVLFTTLWWAMRGTLRLQVDVDQHGIGWRRGTGWRRVPWSSVAAVEATRHRLVLRLETGGAERLPPLRRDALEVLHRTASACLAGARRGHLDDVPDELHAVAGRRAVARPLATSRS